MEGFGGPAQPSPTIGQCLNGGCGWMEAELPFAKQAPASRSMPSAVRAIRRSGNSKVRSDACGTPRYKPPVHLIKLTQEREVTPYVWVHPDDER
jgi:hypothetical protein